MDDLPPHVRNALQQRGIKVENIRVMTDGTEAIINIPLDTLIQAFGGDMLLLADFLDKEKRPTKNKYEWVPRDYYDIADIGSSIHSTRINNFLEAEKGVALAIDTAYGETAIYDNLELVAMNALEAVPKLRDQSLGKVYMEYFLQYVDRENRSSFIKSLRPKMHPNGTITVTYRNTPETYERIVSPFLNNEFSVSNPIQLTTSEEIICSQGIMDLQMQRDIQTHNYGPQHVKLLLSTGYEEFLKHPEYLQPMRFVANLKD
jgi:hypothetical protein